MWRLSKLEVGYWVYVDKPLNLTKGKSDTPAQYTSRKIALEKS